MNKDLNEVLNYMKQYVENIYEHDSEPMLNWKDLKLVLDEIERLKNINEEHRILNGKLRVENSRLNNIINEIESYLEKTIIDGGTRGSMTFWYKQIYDYLQELKGSDKE